MRHLVLFVTLCMLLWVASSSPINHRRKLINRPSVRDMFESSRNRRFANDYYGVKGRMPSVQSRMGSQPMDYGLRKGEYICGNRVCKLQPGEIPKGCGGICQYPINPPIY